MRIALATLRAAAQRRSICIRTAPTPSLFLASSAPFSLPRQSLRSTHHNAHHGHHTPSSEVAHGPVKLQFIVEKSPTIPAASSSSAQVSKPSKPPVVVMHGLLGSANNYRSLLPRLRAELNRTVYALDLRNHGRSPHVPSMTYAEMAEDLRLFLHDQGHDRAVVVGHSLGGKVAMTFATMHPEAVEQLVVVDVSPAPYTRPNETISEVGQVVQTASSLPLERIKTREAAEEWLRAGIPNEGIRRFVLTNFEAGPTRGAWRMNIKAISKFFPSLRETPFASPQAAYHGPTLFIIGSRSNYVDLTTDKGEILTRFPRSSFASIEAGHWVHHERPNEFVSALVNFIGKS